MDLPHKYSFDTMKSFNMELKISISIFIERAKINHIKIKITNEIHMYS